MAHHSSSHHGLLRMVLLFVGVWLVVYIVGPPMYWRFTGKSQAYCPACICDCSSESLLSFPLDCGKHDPDISLELEKDMIGLLTEELNLQRNVTNDNMEHTKSAILEARKTSSQYQKEAEKCNSGMETCEEAREKAEAAIIAEHKLSAIWEDRARQHGWKDRRRTYA